MLGRLVVCVALLSASTAAASSGVFIPPLKIDSGPIILDDQPTGEHAVGTSLLIGLHWATLYPKSTRFDIGIGYSGTYLPEDDAPMKTGRERPEALHLANANGAFLELATRLYATPHMRTWFAWRGELLNTNERGILGVTGRIATELWTGVAGGGNKTAILGTLALGVYAEAGVRESALGSGAVRTVSFGFTGRIPLLIAN